LINNDLSFQFLSFLLVPMLKWLSLSFGLNTLSSLYMGNRNFFKKSNIPLEKELRHIQLSTFLLLLFLLLCSHRILLCIMGICYISLLHTKSPSYMDFFEKFIYVNMNMSSIEVFLLRDCLRKYILLSIAKMKYWNILFEGSFIDDVYRIHLTNSLPSG